MVSPIAPPKLLFYLFLINLSLLVKVAFGYDCDPTTHKVNLNPASYCTEKKNGFGDGTWFGDSCRAVGSTSDCECSCIGDYYVFGTAVTFKCVSTYNSNDHYCFKGSAPCTTCDWASRVDGCGCTDLSPWTCSPGTCIACRTGTYSPYKNTCVDCTAKCDPGNYISSPCEQGGLHDIVCKACEVGHYCLDGKNANICPTGHVCPSAGLSAPTVCSAQQNTDQLCDVEGLTAPKIGCVAGKRHDGDICVLCGAGTYISDGFHQKTACDICSAGTRSQASSGSTSCIVCLSGQYSSQDASFDCKICEKGSYQVNDGATLCVECAIGTYKSIKGASTPCDNCAAGTYATVSISATECRQCNYGTYSNIEAQVSCQSCENGKTIFDRNGDRFQAISRPHDDPNLCKPCDKGYYTCNERDLLGILTNCIFEDKVKEYCVPCPYDSYCPGGGFPIKKKTYTPSITFVLSHGNSSTDNIISDCTICKRDEYESVRCDAEKDGTCTRCSKPILLKTFLIENCSRFDDAKFSACDADSGHLTRGGICNPCLPGTKSSEIGCEICPENTFSVDGKACNNCVEGTGSGKGASMCTTICSPGQFSHDGTRASCKEIESASVTRIAAKWDGLQSVEVGVQMVDGSLLASNTIAGKGAIWLMGMDKAWGVAGDQNTVHIDSYDGVGSLAHFGKITAMVATSSQHIKSIPGVETFLITDINSNPPAAVVSVRLLYFEQSTGIFSTETLNILDSENKILQPSGLISSSVDDGSFFLLSDKRAHCVFKINYNSVTDKYKLVLWRGVFEETVVLPAFSFLSSGGKYLNNPSSLARLSGSSSSAGDNYLVLDNYVIWSFSSSVQPSSGNDLNYVCGTTDQGISSFPMRCDQLNLINMGVNAMATAVKGNSQTIVILSFLSPNGQGILSFTPVSNANSIGSIVYIVSSDFSSFQRITNVFSGIFNVFVTLAGEGSSFSSQVLEVGTYACLCDAGFYCHENTNNCVQSPVGTYTSSWSPRPVQCKSGTVSRGPGGKDSQGWCSQCTLDSFTTYSPGAFNCEPICLNGQILNRELKRCVDGCNTSKGEYFDFDKTCKICPLGSRAESGSIAVGPVLGCPLCPTSTMGISPGVCKNCPPETTTMFTGSTICMPTISKPCVDGIYGVTECSLNDNRGDRISSLIISSPLVPSEYSINYNSTRGQGDADNDLIKGLVVTSGGTLFLATGNDIWKIDRSNSPLSNKSLLVTTNNDNFLSSIYNSNNRNQAKLLLNNSIFEVDFPLELIEVSDDGGSTIFATQIGQSCIWKLDIGDTPKTISEPWVGVCGSPGDMNGINGAARLGSITNMALMEYEGRTSILYVSTVSSVGCATIRSVSLFDGSVSTFLGFDALQMPVILSLTCPEVASPFILSIPRGSALLYYASGANVYLAQVYEINNSTGEINAPSIEISLVNPISAMCSRADGTLAMIEGKTGDLTISTTSVFQGVISQPQYKTVPSFMNSSMYDGATKITSLNDRKNFAWVGRHVWYTVYSYDITGKSISSMVEESSLKEIPLTSGSCIGGYISTVDKVCFQVGSGRYTSPSNGVVNCKGGTYGTLPSGAAGSSHLICKECPIGSISSEGAIICSVCPMEAPYASQDATACVSKCPGGSFLQFNNNDTLIQRGSCKSCPSGYSSVGGIRSIAECSQCAAGTFSNSQTFGICEACPAGWTSVKGSHSCVKLCEEGYCSVDGSICSPKTSNWELMTSIQLETGAPAWSVAVGNAGGVFYTDNTRIIYFLDDCPAHAKLSDWSDDNCRKSGENILPDLKCTRCNRGISAMVLDSNMVNDGITTKRYLYVASKKTHSIYRLPIIYTSGIVDIRETKTILQKYAVGTATLLDHWLLTGIGTGGFLDGKLSDAIFNSPSDIQISSDSKYLFISDFTNHRIRMANLTSGMVTTVLGTGEPCWRNGDAKCPVGAAPATCDSYYSSSCASVKWPLGIALSDESDNNAVTMYLAMNTENAVGILSNVLSDIQPSIFSRYCTLLFANVGNSIETCSNVASSKTCMLKEAYDVKFYSNSLYVLFKNGLTKIDLVSGNCQQIIGSYWDFTRKSGGFVDGGISDTTHTSDARVDIPFRLSIAKDRGILYIADLNNGAIRRVFINGQCRCPEGSLFVSKARSCYNPTQKWSTREIIKCPYGQFALEGEARCRTCMEADVYNIETVPSCVLWKQGITASSMRNIGFPYAKIVGNPMPSTATQSDWYGSNPPNSPSWDDIFRKDSPVMYNLGPTNGRAPWGGEFSTYTYNTDTSLWVRDMDPILKPILLLPGFWYPCVYDNGACKCSKLISKFETSLYGSDLLSISSSYQDKKTWETLRMAAVDNEGKVLGSNALLTDFANGSFIADASYNIHAWSKFMIVGTKYRAPDVCSMHGNGPCFPQFEHIFAEPILSPSFSDGDYNSLTPKDPDGFKEITCSIGWPAHYMCSNGYVWVAPSTTELKLTDGGKQQIMEPMNSQIACLSCLPGTFSHVSLSIKLLKGGPYKCNKCKRGEYSALIGSTSCSLCPSGTYADVEGSTFCKQCEPNHWTKQGAQVRSACSPCAPGTGSCQHCSAGQYQDLSAQNECVDCPPGSVSSSLNQTSCTPCRGNTYQARPAMAICDICGHGAQVNAQHTACIPCKPSPCSLSLGGICGTGCGLNFYWDDKQCVKCPYGFLNGYDTCARSITSCNEHLPMQYIYQQGDITTGGDIIKDCPFGSEPAISKSACLLCVPGRYGTLSNGCEACPPGYFSNQNNQSECLPCAPGKYAKYTESTVCSDCDLGYYSPTQGASECFGCSMGHYAPYEGLTACKTCNNGTYSTSNNSAHECEDKCDASAGFFSGQGASACTYCDGGLVGENSNCIGCGLGMYENNNSVTGKRECKQCPAGKVNRYETHANNVSICVSCSSPIEYSSMDAKTCFTANIGYFPRDDRMGTVACPKGTYRNYGNMSCEKCKDGYYSSKVGQVACLPCDRGYFRSGELNGRASCPACMSGLVSKEIGSTTCTMCPAGHVSNSFRSGCESCVENTYQFYESCRDCDPPLVSERGSSDRSDCKICPMWTFYNHGICTLCPPGTFTAVDPMGGGLYICVACGVGTQNPNRGSNSSDDCKACGPGYVADAQRTSCTTCPLGQRAINGTICEKCSAGSFSPNGTVCTACEMGKYSDDQGKSYCELCRPGSWSNGTGQTSCISCNRGTFSNVSGSTACSSCRITTGFSSVQGSTVCTPRKTTCNEGYYMILRNDIPDSDHLCEKCGDCAENQYKVSIFKDVNPDDVSNLCPGNYTFPGVRCVDNERTAGVYFLQSEFAGASADLNNGEILNIGSVSCSDLTSSDLDTFAYVIGPSAFRCYVGCLYGIKENGLTLYQTKNTDINYPSNEEVIIDNIFYPRVVRLSSEVCAPCPQSPCPIGKYRPFGNRGNGTCGPTCALPEFRERCTDPNGEKNLGCYGICKHAPPDAEITGGSAILGNDTCPWKCKDRWHLNEDGSGCLPCTKNVTICSTGFVMIPESECLYYHKRQDLCKFCSVIEGGVANGWNSRLNKCTYTCFSGYYPSNADNTGCISCNINNSVNCPIGMFRNVYNCAVNAVEPTCSPCTIPDNLKNSISFTTHGGILLNRPDNNNTGQCSALCNAGYHTAISNSQNRQYVSDLSVGLPVNQISCEICTIFDSVPCKGKCASGQYRNLLIESDSTPGACLQCMRNDQCAPGWFAPECSGNGTSNVACIQCNSSLLTQRQETGGMAKRREFVSYEIQKSNTNIHIYPAFPGACPSVCINNYIQDDNDASKCVSCEAYVKSKGCESETKSLEYYDSLQPKPCDFRFSHWNALPDNIWWDTTKYTPSFLKGNLFLSSTQNNKYIRAGLCWACPLGRATFAEDGDLCMLLSGYGKTSSISILTQKIPIPSTGIQIYMATLEPQILPSSFYGDLVYNQVSSTNNRRRRLMMTLDIRKREDSDATTSSHVSIYKQDDDMESGASLVTVSGSIISSEVTGTPCKHGYYKAERSDELCTQCPYGTSTVSEASVGIAQCLCYPGWFRGKIIKNIISNESNDNISANIIQRQSMACLPCPANTYRAINSIGEDGCKSCPPNETTHGRVNTTRCSCIAGFIRNRDNICEPCQAGSYCTPCIEGYTCPQEGVIITPCFRNSTSPPGSISMDNCSCLSGLVSLHRSSDLFNRYCATVPPSAIFNPVIGRVECKRGWTAQWKDEQLIGCYLCPLGKYAQEDPGSSNMTTVNCIDCPLGSYSGTLDAIGNCTLCPYPQTTQNIGSRSPEDCGCPPPTTMSPQKKCEGCVKDQYLSPLTKRCEYCPLFSIAKVGATSASDCICIPGYYLDATKPACMPCEMGKYSSHASNGICRNCPRGSTTSDIGSKNILDCNVCLSGFTLRSNIGCILASSVY